MSLTIFPHVVQRSEEWDRLRLGIITSSIVSGLLTAGGRVADNDTSRKTILGLAAERMTGYSEPGRVSSDMWRGIEEEPLARDAYSQHQAPVTECGFMIRTLPDGCRIGYSPDGLVGDVGQIEIKSRLHHIHMATILGGEEVPGAVYAQLQHGLLVSGRAWVDYVSYSGGMPLWVKRIHRDETWANAILAAVRNAEQRIAELTTKFRTITAGLPVMPRTSDYYEIEV